MVVRKKLVKKPYNDRQADEFISRGGSVNSYTNVKEDPIRKTTLRMPQSLIDKIDKARKIIKPKAPSANEWIMNLIYKKLKK